MDDSTIKLKTVNFKDLKDLYREISSRESMRKRLGSDAIFASLDRQALQEEGETAFLIEKTDQQSFLTLMAGVIATGPVSSTMDLKIFPIVLSIFQVLSTQPSLF